MKRPSVLETALEAAIAKSGRSGGATAVPASKQIFKCKGCGNFFRLPERRAELCPGCFAVKEENREASEVEERVDEEDGC